MTDNMIYAALRCYGRAHNLSYRNCQAFRNVISAVGSLRWQLSSPNDDTYEVDKRCFDLRQGVFLQRHLELGLGRGHQRSLVEATSAAVDARVLRPQALHVAKRANNARHKRWRRQPRLVSVREAPTFPSRPPGIWHHGENVFASFARGYHAGMASTAATLLSYSASSISLGHGKPRDAQSLDGSAVEFVPPGELPDRVRTFWRSRGFSVKKKRRFRCFSHHATH